MQKLINIWWIYVYIADLLKFLFDKLLQICYIIFHYDKLSLWSVVLEIYVWELSLQVKHWKKWRTTRVLLHDLSLEEGLLLLLLLLQASFYPANLNLLQYELKTLQWLLEATVLTNYLAVPIGETAWIGVLTLKMGRAMISLYWCVLHLWNKFWTIRLSSIARNKFLATVEWNV